MIPWFEFLFRHRPAVLGLGLTLLVLAGYLASGMVTDNSLERMMPEDDPQMNILLDMTRLFGSNEFTLIAWQTDDLFSNEEIGKIRELTRRFQDLPEVQWVTSLTNIVSIADVDDALLVEPLIDPDLRTFSPAQLARIRERALADTLMHRNLISPDGRTTTITLGLERLDQVNPEFRVELAGKIEAILDEFGGNENYYLAGTAPIQKIYNASIKHDIKLFYPLTLVLLALALFFVFRSFSGVIVPFISMASTSILTIGAYAAAGHSINVVTTMLPPLIMVMTTSAVVHIIAHSRQQQGIPWTRAVALAAASVTVPVLHNCLTSTIGFGSLAVSQVAPVRNFGLFAALGMAIILLFNVTMVPVLLSLRPLSRVTSKEARPTLGDRLIHGLISSCESLTRNHRKLVLGFSGALLVLAVIGVARIQVETNLMDHFDPASRIRRDLQAIQDNLTGTMSLDIIVEASREGAALEAETIKYVDDLMNDFARQDIVLSAQSLSSVLRRVHLLYSRQEGLPPSTEANVQYFDFFLSGAGRLIDQFMDSSRTTLRITGRHRYVSSKKSMELAAWLENRLQEDRPSTVKRVYLSGLTPVYNNMVHSIVSGQLWGFSLALVLITAIMILIQRSLKLGLTAMIPNILPVAVTAGLMGHLGISLNTATAMIASIAIGIAVDDTIHFTTFYRRFRNQGLSSEDSISRVLHTAGPAMITTSLVLFVGFMVLVLSDFGPIRMFGLLSGSVMISALFGDLVLLPGLLTLVDRKAGSLSPENNDQL